MWFAFMPAIAIGVWVLLMCATLLWDEYHDKDDS